MNESQRGGLAVVHAVLDRELGGVPHLLGLHAFDEVTPQTVTDGNTIDFLCDGNVTSKQVLAPGVSAVWTPATSVLANLIEDGYYLFAILMNVKPSNEIGELLINLVDTPSTLPALFLGNSGMENQVEDAYGFTQTVMNMLVPAAAAPLTFKFEITPLGMDVDLAEREIQITRTM